MGIVCDLLTVFFFINFYLFKYSRFVYSLMATSDSPGRFGQLKSVVDEYVYWDNYKDKDFFIIIIFL